jgi:hypothetical protein
MVSVVDYAMFIPNDKTSGLTVILGKVEGERLIWNRDSGIIILSRFHILHRVAHIIFSILVSTRNCNAVTITMKDIIHLVLEREDTISLEEGKGISIAREQLNGGIQVGHDSYLSVVNNSFGLVNETSLFTDSHGLF